MRIEVVKGKTEWFWRLVAKNGQTRCVAEGFHSKGNAKRAANRMSHDMLGVYNGSCNPPQMTPVPVVVLEGK